jgi:GNAT superfamily N-acetyltransferase
MSIQIIERDAPAHALVDFCALAPALTPAQWHAQSPDQAILVDDAQGRPAARASLWWKPPLHLDGQRAGCIGHYAAGDRAAAAHLLATACQALAAAGCAVAVGPLDGSTFRAYRFVTVPSVDGVAQPPFWLEPQNPAIWPEDFSAAGFVGCADYLSARAKLSGPDPELARLTPLLQAQGFRLRPLAPTAFDAELARLYPLVMTAFADNLLFAPITQAEFIAQYAPLRAYIQPELVWLAEAAGETVGFLLALPDLAQAQRGQPIDTVILKTLAVRSGLTRQGIGAWLTAAVHTQAAALGYQWAIHALMHVDNPSRRISRHTAQVIRAYRLYARRLTPPT